MQKDEKHIAPEETGGNGKKKKQKSFLETVREIDAKERQREAEIEAEQQRIKAERRKAAQEAYDKKIRQERIELMRLKQGIVEEKDSILYEAPVEEKKRSFWKKIGDFFYHNKWWLIITTCIVGIFTFLTVDYIMQVRPDMIVMVLTDDEAMQFSGERISDYFEQFIEDENGDGKVTVAVYPIPVNDSIGEDDYYTGNGTKLSTQFQMGEAVMLITDAKANQYIYADEHLVDLEELFPDCKNIRDKGFYLRNTDFMERIGLPDKLLDRDICISLRKVTETTFDSKEDMQEHYDIAYAAFQQVMEDLPYVQKPLNNPPAEVVPSESE